MILRRPPQYVSWFNGIVYSLSRSYFSSELTESNIHHGPLSTTASRKTRNINDALLYLIFSHESSSYHPLQQCPPDLDPLISSEG